MTCSQKLNQSFAAHYKHPGICGVEAWELNTCCYANGICVVSGTRIVGFHLQPRWPRSPHTWPVLSLLWFRETRLKSRTPAATKTASTHCTLALFRVRRCCIIHVFSVCVLLHLARSSRKPATVTATMPGLVHSWAESPQSAASARC